MNSRNRRLVSISTSKWFGLLMCASVFGCAGGANGDKQARLSAEASNWAAVDAGVDASRARVALDDIEPKIAKPTRGESVAPLSERSTKQIASAKSLMETQRYTEAALELEKALRYDPNHPDVHRALAELHWAAGNTARAKQHVQQVVTANPADATAQYVLGRCLQADGGAAGAFTAFRTARLCDGFDKEPVTAALTCVFLGELLVKEGYLEAAIGQFREFEKRVRAMGEPPVDSELGMLWRGGAGPFRDSLASALEKLGRPSEAADALMAASGSGPVDTKRLLQSVRLLARAGRFDEALKAARSAPADDLEVWQTVIDVYVQQGRVDEALAEIRSRLDQPKADASVVLLLADCLTKLNRSQEVPGVLRKFLERNPAANAVRDRLIDEYTRAGQWKEALGELARMIEADAGSTSDVEKRIRGIASQPAAVDAILGMQDAKGHVADYLRGSVAFHARRYDSAEKLLRDAYEGNRSFVPARAALAKLYVDQHRYDEALKIAARADDEKVEDERLELVLGEIHDRLDDIRVAEMHYRAVLERDRTNGAALFALARLSRRSGDFLQAQQQLRALLKQNPADEAAHEMLAYLLLERGEVDAAFRQIEELKKVATSPTTRARCVALLEQTKNPDRAAYRASLMKAMNESSPDGATWLAVAESFEEFEYVQATEAYKKAIEYSPESEEARVGLKDALRRGLQFESSAEQLAKLLERHPNRHVWRLEMIDLHLALGEVERALTACREQVSRTDTDERVRRAYQLKLATLLKDSGRQAEAIELLKQWSEAEGDGPFWLVQWARTLEEAKKHADAVPLYEKVVQLEPGNQSVWRDLALARAAAGQADRAAQDVLTRLADDPESDATVSMMVRVLAESNRLDDMTEVMRNRLLRTAEREAFQDLWIGLLAQKEKYEPSIDLVEKLMDQLQETARRMSAEQPVSATLLDAGRRLLMPNDPITPERLEDRMRQLRQRLAVLLISAKRYREAERSLSGWMESTRDPRAQLDYLILLAGVHQRLGSDDQSQTLMEQALMLNAEDPTINNDVAYGWINRGIRLNEAERLIRYALGRDPKSAAYLDTFGWLQYKKGEFGEAAKWLKRAVANADKPDAVLCDHLGDALWKLGRKEEAIEQWGKALSILSSAEPTKKDPLTVDERRVQQSTPQKVENARAGREPVVAAVGETKE